ncbi:hypothetical protein WAI453_009682 [Rhynchosporium graminicola]
MSEQDSNHEHPDGILDTQATDQSRSCRATRIKSACARCQHRKIRCNGRNPVCSSCKRSGLACMSSAKHNDRSSKAYVASLQDILRSPKRDRRRQFSRHYRAFCVRVSVTAGQDLRYVGPSSGYSFAKLLFANISRRNATRGQNGLIWLRIALQATSFALDPVHYLLLSRMLFNYLKTIGIMCNTNTHSSTNQAT